MVLWVTLAIVALNVVAVVLLVGAFGLERRHRTAAGGVSCEVSRPDEPVTV